MVATLEKLTRGSGPISSGTPCMEKPRMKRQNGRIHWPASLVQDFDS